MSLVMRKPAFCICENKDADQPCGNREADQRLCFRYTDTTIPLLSKSEISSFYPSSVAVQTGLCGAWSETRETGFLTTGSNSVVYFSHKEQKETASNKQHKLKAIYSRTISCHFPNCKIIIWKAQGVPQ